MISRGRLIGWSFELDRIARVLAIAREELAFRVLAEEDWLELGRSMYGRSAKYSLGSAHNESGLFAFERAAIDEAFPPPPASILIGGCGGGLRQGLRRSGTVELQQEAGLSGEVAFGRMPKAKVADLVEAGREHMLEEAVDQALKDGYKGLWATGDMTWEFGTEKNLSKLLDYECGLERLFQAKPALSGICQYHKDTLPTDILRDALLTHPSIFISDTLQCVNPYYVPPDSRRSARPDLHVPIDIDKIIRQVTHPGRTD